MDIEIVGKAQPVRLPDILAMGLDLGIYSISGVDGSLVLMNGYDLSFLGLASVSSENSNADYGKNQDRKSFHDGRSSTGYSPRSQVSRSGSIHFRSSGLQGDR